jgi:hypothetical protein
MSVSKAILFSNDGSDEFSAFFALDFMADYHFTTDPERLQVLFLLDRVFHRIANKGHNIRRHNPLLNPFHHFAKACLDAFKSGAPVRQCLLCFSAEEEAAAQHILSSTRRLLDRGAVGVVLCDLQRLRVERKRVVRLLE